MSDQKVPNALKELNPQALDFLKHKGEDMMQNFQKMQEDLKARKIVGLAGIKDSDAIYVECTLDGLQEVKVLDIGDGAMEEGKKVLTDLITSAFNSATTKLKTIMQQEVMSVYEKAGLPLTGEEEGK